MIRKKVITCNKCNKPAKISSVFPNDTLCVECQYPDTKGVKITNTRTEEYRQEKW